MNDEGDPNMSDETTGATVDEQAAERLLEKVRAFIHDELTPEERALFAVLLAPGVAEANGSSDVSGFAADVWEPAPLPDHLARMVRASGMRIVTDA
jgi:hypothetical protein